MARLITATDVINRTLVEVGLRSETDPVGSTQDTSIQMVQLLNSAGAELVELFPWQLITKEFSFTTVVPGDTGTYDLPEDFAYLINQTGWDKTNRVRMGGPLSAQDWSQLEGRDLVSQSIYASFRVLENKLDLYPQPPPNGLEIRFEYVSRDWVVEADGTTYRDTVGAGSDTVLYEPILIVKYLKCKWLEAKGFDSSSARMEFENMMNSRTSRDQGAPKLNAAGGSRGVPYLNSYHNTPDTGYGIP